MFGDNEGIYQRNLQRLEFAARSAKDCANCVWLYETEHFSYKSLITLVRRQRNICSCICRNFLDPLQDRRVRRPVAFVFCFDLRCGLEILGWTVRSCAHGVNSKRWSERKRLTIWTYILAPGSRSVIIAPCGEDRDDLPLRSWKPYTSRELPFCLCCSVRTLAEVFA